MARAAALKKVEEQPLPTMSDEDLVIPEIQESAASLLDIRTRRIALTKEEDEAEKLVVKAMEKNDRDYYNHDGLEVTVSKGRSKAKVKYSGDEEQI